MALGVWQSEFTSAARTARSARRTTSAYSRTNSRLVGLPSSYETKKPPAWAGGSLAYTVGFSLPADLEVGSTTRGAVAGVTGRDQLDPKRILVLEVRVVAGRAQRIQAGLLRTRGCGGESRQLEDYPRAAIQLRHGEVHVRPFGGHLDLGTGSYAARGYGVLLAIAAENDRRLSRRSCTGTASTALTTATASSARSTRCAWAARTALTTAACSNGRCGRCALTGRSRRNGTSAGATTASSCACTGRTSGSATTARRAASTASTSSGVA